MVVGQQEDVCAAAGDVFRIIVGSGECGVAGVGRTAQRELQVGYAEAGLLHVGLDVAQEIFLVVLQLLAVHHHVADDEEARGVAGKVQRLGRSDFVVVLGAGTGYGREQEKKCDYQSAHSQI